MEKFDAAYEQYQADKAAGRLPTGATVAEADDEVIPRIETK